MMREWAQAIAESAPHDWAIYALRNVPGMPPIVQTIHIISVAAVVASIVFIHLRVLGLAYPSQQPQDMLKRFTPWFWSSLPVLFLTGLPFVLARPTRYFLNPVFGIKIASLVLVLIVSVFFMRALKQSKPNLSLAAPYKIASVISLGLWLLIILAGRWIAYADYLFPPSF